MLTLRPWLSGLTIKSKDLELARLDVDKKLVLPSGELGDFGWAQRQVVEKVETEFNAGRPLRFIVLKARQLGLSTLTEALMFLWCFWFRGSNGLVISYEDDQAQELFQMMKTYWDHWPHKCLYSLQYSTKRQLRWRETGSQVRVATAKNVTGSKRGSTVQALHASEVAFWPDPGPLWVGLNQTIPTRHGTMVVLESTANGIGNWFYDKWVEADNGESEYIPLFFPYFRHYEYRMHTTLCVKSELNADERKLLRLMSAEGYAEDTCYQTIAWRRWAIINKCNGDVLYFMQEYPSTPDEAFIATGKPIFNFESVRRAYDRRTGVTGRLYRNGVGKVIFKPDPSGPLTIYVRPSDDARGDRFFISGDPSETVQGDPGCMQVLDRKTYEVVAVWHAQTNPVYFAQEMLLLGEFYNRGMICPEVEGGGQACIGYILKSGYDNIWRDKRPDRLRASTNVFGWSTNITRKQWCVGQLQKRLLDGSLVIHDPKTYNQLISFVEHEDGYWGNSNPKIHDDAVMALAIGVTASEEEGPFQLFRGTGGHSNPIADIYQSQNPDEGGYNWQEGEVA